MKRGTDFNPANPFERLHFEEDPGLEEEMRRTDPEWARPHLRTQFFKDDSQSLISKNESEDLSFEASINPYRGCEHGCAYCYARRYHEYLGFSGGLDFESKIMVKVRAPELLRNELSRRSWRPQKLSMSGVTDCYQPVEKRLEITRGCLSVLAEFRNPVLVITKNHLVTRDTDHLVELSRWRACAVFVSLTTLEQKLCQSMEPRASLPSMRLRAIQTLSQAGIPVGVAVAPVIPGLNDMEIPALLEEARAAGATFATYSLVRLPGSGAKVFREWLDRNVSAEKKAAVLRGIEETQGGSLNDSRPFLRMRGTGEYAGQIAQLFKVLSRKLGFEGMRPELSVEHFRRPGGTQLSLSF